MRSGKKIILLCICLTAVVTASVFGTLAFLTDRDSVVNTFTVGKVDITVDETKVNPDGTMALDAERVKANEYHLLPGMTYVKDPAVTLLAGSEDSYIRMILTVHNASGVQGILDKYSLGDFSVLIGGWDEEVWLYKGFSTDTENNIISFEFRYREAAVSGEDDTMLPPLFTTLIVPGEISNSEMKALYEGAFKLEVFGHAIQADGFTDQTDSENNILKTAEEAAWEAFDRQMARN